MAVGGGVVNVKSVILVIFQDFTIRLLLASQAQPAYKGVPEANVSKVGLFSEAQSPPSLEQNTFDCLVNMKISDHHGHTEIESMCKIIETSISDSKYGTSFLERPRLF